MFFFSMQVKISRQVCVTGGNRFFGGSSWIQTGKQTRRRMRETQDWELENFHNVCDNNLEENRGLSWSLNPGRSWVNEEQLSLWHRTWRTCIPLLRKRERKKGLEKERKYCWPPVLPLSLCRRCNYGINLGDFRDRMHSQDFHKTSTLTLTLRSRHKLLQDF